MSISDHTPIPDGYKRCSRGEFCAHPLGPVLPATDVHFHKRYKDRDKLHTLCRICQNAACKANSQRPSQKEKERARQKTPERKLYNKSRHSSPEYKAYEKAYRQSEKGRLANCAKSHRRRALERSLPSDFSSTEWERAKNAFAIKGVHCCAYCGKPQGLWRALVQDHFIPAIKGGGYTASNIVPACHGIDGCNNSKNNRDAHEWLLWKFGKRKAARIEKAIVAYFQLIKGEKT